MIILERELTLTEDHQRDASTFSGEAVTMFDQMIFNLWLHFRPCDIKINGQKMHFYWNIFSDLSLSIGQTITIQVEVAD